MKLCIVIKYDSDKSKLESEENIIKLPFIMLATDNAPDNTVNFYS